MTVREWRLADTYMGLVSASRIYRERNLLHPNQLNLNQFLEAGSWVTECSYSLPGDAKVWSGWRPVCKRRMKASMSGILMIMISAVSLLFLLVFGFFSTLHFVTVHPVLKILSIRFFLQAHSFLLLCLSQEFGKTLIACFYLCVCVCVCVFSPHEWDMGKLCEKCFKFINVEK